METFNIIISIEDFKICIKLGFFFLIESHSIDKDLICVVTCSQARHCFLFCLYFRNTSISQLQWRTLCLKVSPCMDLQVCLWYYTDFNIFMGGIVMVPPPDQHPWISNQWLTDYLFLIIASELEVNDEKPLGKMSLILIIMVKYAAA